VGEADARGKDAEAEAQRPVYRETEEM